MLGFQAPLLRSVADQLKLTPVKVIAQQPGVQEVYRVTVHYFDGRACNSVTTLRRVFPDGIVLETVYQHALREQPLIHRLDEPRFEEFVKAVKGLRFDKLADQPDLPDHHTTDLWLVERASGTFIHSVILAPELARDQHNALANAIKHGLPEALRVVK